MTREDETWQKVKEAFKQREKELRRDFDRSLPFQDAMFDREERARELGFGDRASIYNSAHVFGAVSVGDKTWIGPNVILDGSGGGIVIGSTCSISTGVHVYTHDSLQWALTGGRASYFKAPVSIGNCCYIGPQSVISAGVSIGDQCVVATNSFVKDSFPARTIIGGTPAKRLGFVDMDGADPILVYDSKGQ